MKQLLFFLLLIATLYAQELRPGSYVMTQTIQYDTIIVSTQLRVRVEDWEETPDGMRTNIVRKNGTYMKYEIKGTRHYLGGIEVEHSSNALSHGGSIHVTYMFERLVVIKF